MKASFLLVLLSCLYACTNQEGQNSEALVKGMDSNIATTPALKDSIPGNHNTSLDKDTIPKNIQVDTVIHLAFAKDSSRLEAKGTLNKQSQPVICYLPINRKTKLIAALVPENKSLNIRFSQIITPGGELDGPFGKLMTYDLLQAGVYKFIIGSNQMADGLRSGDFWIRIELKTIK